jgi:hypothetical protein
MRDAVSPNPLGSAIQCHLQHHHRKSLWVLAIDILQICHHCSGRIWCPLVLGFASNSY